MLTMGLCASATVPRYDATPRATAARADARVALDDALSQQMRQQY